jgi:hypothetical protein
LKGKLSMSDSGFRRLPQRKAESFASTLFSIPATSGQHTLRQCSRQLPLDQHSQSRQAIEAECVYMLPEERSYYQWAQMLLWWISSTPRLVVGGTLADTSLNYLFKVVGMQRKNSSVPE